LLLEGVHVARHANLVLEAALDEIVGDLRQAPLGELAQVFEIDGGVQRCGHNGHFPQGFIGCSAQIAWPSAGWRDEIYSRRSLCGSGPGVEQLFIRRASAGKETAWPNPCP